MNDILDKVISIVTEYVFDKNIMKSAVPDSNLVMDLKINSARIVDIVLDIEDEFQIEIDYKSLENIETINDITTVIKEKIQGGK